MTKPSPKEPAPSARRAPGPERVATQPGYAWSAVALRPMGPALRSLAGDLPRRDPAEVDADEAAESFLRGRVPSPRPSPNGRGVVAVPEVARAALASTSEPLSVDRRAYFEPSPSGRGVVAVPEVARAALASTSEPLSADRRAYFEQRVGRDLTSVRVHRGAEAARAASALGSEAFAFGDHIALGDGAGPRTLAHEIAHVAQGGGGLHPRLLMTGAPTDVNALLTLLSGPAGLTMTWDAATHVISATAMAGTPRSPSIRSELLTIIGDAMQDAEVHAGRSQTNTVVGGFPTPDDLTAGREQHVDVDDLLAVDAGSPGSGAVFAIHEIHENFAAHGVPVVAGTRRFTAAHADSFAVESAASTELIQPGSQRVGDITSAAHTVVRPGVTAYQQLFDYGNYYLLLEMEEQITSAAGVTPRTSDQRVTRACRVNKVVAATHTITGFRRDDATAPTSRRDAHYFAQDYYVTHDLVHWDLHTVLAEGFAGSDEAHPDVVSQARADAVRAWVGRYSSPGEWSAVGRGVPATPTPHHPERDRKVVVTIFRPDPAVCPTPAAATPSPGPGAPTPSPAPGAPQDAGAPTAPRDAGTPGVAPPDSGIPDAGRAPRP